MKTLLKHPKFFLGLMAMLCSLPMFAQTDWYTRGNTADSAYFLGTVNALPLRIKTDSVDRIIVGVNDTIEFKGTAVFDSVAISTGHLQVDSIRARVIHVGDSSLVLGTGNVANPGDNIIYTTSQGGQSLFLAPFNGVASFVNSSAVFTTLDNARVGIGIVVPNNQLQLFRNTGIQVATQYTNSNTGSAAANGFLVGIDAAGNAILNQQSNSRHILLSTVGAGNVGIGLATPQSVLHLNRNATVPVVTQYTNANTGSAVNDGFIVGVDNNGNGNGLLNLRNDMAIDIWTGSPAMFPSDNTLKASFTSSDFFGNAGVPGTLGDGLRIWDPNYLNGNLDLWTSASNQTHIVWGPNGRIQGINNRLEIQGDFTDGLWFNVADPTTGTFFNSQGVENGRIGANTFWRIGPNTGNVDATHTLEVDGNVRIRDVANATSPPDALIVGINQTGVGDVELQRLDFTGSTTQVLLGDGTWGAVPGAVTNCAAPIADRITKWCGAGGTEIEQTIMYEENDTRVGVDIFSNLQAKFHVNNGTELTGGFFNTTITGPSIGVAARTNSTTSLNVAVLGQAAPNTVSLNIPSVNILPAIGVAAVPNNTGVWGQGAGNLFNFGGVFEANHCPGNFRNYGVYASARRSVPGACGGFANAGYFQGNVVYTGVLQDVSDETLKDSIQAINNALTIIGHLQLKQFVFKSDSFPYMNLPIGTRYGVIAQQIDTILPQLVVEVLQPQIRDTTGAILQDTMTIKTVNYTNLIPIAIAGIQEQQAIIDSLKDEQITADATGVTDTNRVVKWSFTDRKLTNSLLYDDGSRLGLPAVKQGSYLNVENTGTDTVAVNATSTNPNTTAVVNAVYTVDSGESNVVAVRGYSKYLFEPGQHDGIGGAFEGGKWGAYSLASGANNQSIGLVGESKNATNRNYGVMGVSRSTTSADNFGVQGIADSSEEANGGVIGVAEYVNATSVNIGLSGFAGGSGNENIAGEFEAWDTTGVNYGIFAYANGTAPNAYAGYFDGDVHATGTITWTSDANLKENVKNVDADVTLAKIMRLQPKTYTFRAKDYPYLSLPNGNQYGLLAQEVQQVFPELVTDVTQPERRDRNGNVVSPKLEYKGLNYAGLIPILVGAVKQQQTKIDSLSEVITNRLDALEARLNGCCGTGSANKTADENAATPHQLTVELSSTQVVILEQNVPNPFAEQTSISYFIPENITNAQLVFTDILGNNIKQVEVKSGYGTVTVFASNLTSGQYSYSLVIDGKVVETKRMVKTK